MMNKKGLSFLEHWAEGYSALGFILGFIIALLLRNEYTLYVISSVGGIVAGRTLWLARKHPIFPYYLVSIATLIGFLLGALVGSNATLKIIFLLAIVSAYLSHFIHRKGYI